MIHINLLPWREEKRETIKQQYKRQLIITIVTVVIVAIAIHVWLALGLNRQQNRNQFLQQTTQSYDQRIQEISKIQILRKEINERKNIIFYLQANRAFAVLLFVDFINITPDGVYFTEIEREDKTLTFEGKADSNAQVSQLMRNISHSLWLNDAKLGVIKVDKNNPYQRTFKLTVNEKIKQPNFKTMVKP